MVVALDLRAFLAGQERWAVAGQTLSILAAVACFSLLSGNAAVARWLSWALIGLGIVSSLGLLTARLLGRRP